MDHVVPEALGGSHDPPNLVTACSDCNGGKSATPPDAVHVAQVAEDALRWAEAIRAAAATMVADLSARQADRDAFAKAWDSWTYGGDKIPVPRPDTWERSIDAFMTAGLPMPVLLECVKTAMVNGRVPPDQTFRYVCGMAWKRVADLQEAARTAAAGTGGAGDGPEGDRWAERLLATLTGCDHDFAKALEAARSEIALLEPDEEGTRDPLLYAIDEVVSLREGERYSLHNALGRILRLLPDDRRHSARKQAAQWYRQADHNPTESELLSKTAWFYAVTLAEDYLEGLDPAERDEWLEGTRTWYGTTPHDGALAIFAAEDAKRYKATGRPRSGMCGWDGDHGAVCPSRVAFVCRYADCPACAPSGCTGHRDWCERHLEEVIGGATVYLDGKPVRLADFEPVGAEVPF